MFSFFLMKMAQSKSQVDFSIEDYYSDVKKDRTRHDLNSKCRVCLNKGVVSIQENADIAKALQIFGDVQVTEGDEYPKFLCNFCHKFLKGAIMFRKMAKHTEAELRRPLKKETFFDDSHDYDDINFESKSQHKWPVDVDVKIEKVKEIKKEKVKGTAKVTCPVCSKVMNRSYYKEHMTMHDPDHQKYICDVCGKSFRLRCAYHNHSLRHRNDFPHKCQFCPYKARYSELLRMHKRTHTGDYRYMCTECPARFLYKSNLNTHMLKHREPQFNCDTCKRAFHTKLTLQKHYEADHLGIKNHVCNMCGKAFGYRNAMMKHQRHVHKREKLLFGRMPTYMVAEKQDSKQNLLPN